MIAPAALHAAVKAALAVKLLRDADADVIASGLIPDEVISLWFQGRIGGRSAGELLDAAAIESMRAQLSHQHGVAVEDFDAAVRRILRRNAS
jgi:hypothetical protein